MRSFEQIYLTNVIHRKTYGNEEDRLFHVLIEMLPVVLIRVMLIYHWSSPEFIINFAVLVSLQERFYD
jgi:hypothetical protein